MKRMMRTALTALLAATMAVPALSLMSVPAHAAAYDRVPPLGPASGRPIPDQAMEDFQRDLGLSRHATAGLLGNFAGETGNWTSIQELDPLIEGSRGGGGWAQWTGPRRRDFEAYAASRGLDTRSYEANYGYAVHDLTNNYPHVLSRLRNAQSPEEATWIVRAYYETPQNGGSETPLGGHNSDNHRLAAANAYLNGDFTNVPTAQPYSGPGYFAGVPGGGGFGGGNTQVSELPRTVLMRFNAFRPGGNMPPGSM